MSSAHNASMAGQSPALTAAIKSKGSCLVWEGRYALVANAVIPSHLYLVVHEPPAALLEAKPVDEPCPRPVLAAVEPLMPCVDGTHR
jgi:hypothetical protein